MDALAKRMGTDERKFFEKHGMKSIPGDRAILPKILHGSPWPANRGTTSDEILLCPRQERLHVSFSAHDHPADSGRVVICADDLDDAVVIHQPQVAQIGAS